MSPLNVYFENRLVGRIEIHELGPNFVYDSAWLRLRGAFPISTTIPLSPTPIEAKVFLPWAANLLPEGTALRRIGELIQAAPEDVIRILSEIGRDTAGALSIGMPGSTDPEDYKEIKTSTNLERIINDLPRKPFLAGDEGVSMSLAGVQSKIGVRQLDGGNLAIPINGAASTHILKPNSETLYGSVQNEAFCLRLAHRSGLKTTELTTGVAGDRSYLLVNRYDRLHVSSRWRRLHQEDFCQALGKPPEAKYESNQTGIKGPTATDIMALARNTLSGPDTIAMLDYIIFSIIVCNTDAHAKNYSMIITSAGPSLAPIYDVVCTQVWDQITPNMSQSIAGQNRGDHLKRRHWERFAQQVGFNPRSMINRVDRLMESVTNQLEGARQDVASMPAGDHVILDHVEKKIKDRLSRLRSGLTEKEAPVAVTKIENADGVTSQTTELNSRAAYVRAMRATDATKDFRKLARKLNNDRNMKAMDVKSIAHELLDQKFASRKAAIAGLESATGPITRLVS